MTEDVVAFGYPTEIIRERKIALNACNLGETVMPQSC
jgi:hypothetical protein